MYNKSMIRRATRDDFDQILSIRAKIGLQRDKLHSTEYIQKIEKEGFLLYPTISLEEYKKEIEKLFLVFEEGTVIEGFIHIDDHHTIACDSPVEWEKQEMKYIYFSKPHAYVSGIAVDPAYAKQGIATKLFNEALKYIKAPYIFSIVVTSPVKNIPSILFHGKQGFERVASIHYENRAELDNYQSIVYSKRI